MTAVATTSTDAILNTEMLDNLANELSTASSERIGTLMVELRELLGPSLTEKQERTMMEYAFHRFDGLRVELREILEDREWAGVRVGPREEAGEDAPPPAEVPAEADPAAAVTEGEGIGEHLAGALLVDHHVTRVGEVIGEIEERFDEIDGLMRALVGESGKLGDWHLDEPLLPNVFKTTPVRYGALPRDRGCVEAQRDR